MSAKMNCSKFNLPHHMVVDLERIQNFLSRPPDDDVLRLEDILTYLKEDGRKTDECLYEEGYDEGKEEGYENGFDCGYEKGYHDREDTKEEITVNLTHVRPEDDPTQMTK
jgi:flagellar biosynthesis/type III secretory pathway protein FliH